MEQGPTRQRKRLRTGRQTLYRLVQRGRLPVFKLGGPRVTYLNEFERRRMIVGIGN